MNITNLYLSNIGKFGTIVTTKGSGVNAPVLAVLKRFFQKTTIAYYLNLRKSTKFWRYAIAVFF